MSEVVEGCRVRIVGGWRRSGVVGGGRRQGPPGRGGPGGGVGGTGGVGWGIPRCPSVGGGVSGVSALGMGGVRNFLPRGWGGVGGGLLCRPPNAQYAFFPSVGGPRQVLLHLVRNLSGRTTKFRQPRGVVKSPCSKFRGRNFLDAHPDRWRRLPSPKFMLDFHLSNDDARGSLW